MIFGASDKDQDEFDAQPPEWHEHLAKSLLHHTGMGEHPGEYAGPTADTTEALAHERLAEAGPPGAPAPQGPPPPQEQVQQPMPGGGKKPQGKQKPPSGTTPTGIGAAAVKPAQPEGEY